LAGASRSNPEKYGVVVTSFHNASKKDLAEKAVFRGFLKKTITFAGNMITI
jgi:hypothetical protein